MVTVYLLSLGLLASLADSLFDAGYYDLARIEYKREFFFQPELKDRRDKRLNYTLSLCYAGHDISYLEMQRFLNDFQIINLDERKKLAAGYIELGDFYTAKGLLAPTEEYRLMAYTCLLDHEWQQARVLAYQSNDQLLTGIIDRYLMQKPKNARTAMVLSALCPGAGETYAGDYKTGVKAFLVNLGTGLLLYNALARKKYVDAALIFNFLFQRFYFGSIFNAKRIALEHNENLENQCINEFAEQAHFKH